MSLFCFVVKYICSLLFWCLFKIWSRRVICFCNFSDIWYNVSINKLQCFPSLSQSISQCNRSWILGITLLQSAVHRLCRSHCITALCRSYSQLIQSLSEINYTAKNLHDYMQPTVGYSRVVLLGTPEDPALCLCTRKWALYSTPEQEAACACPLYDL